MSPHSGNTVEINGEEYEATHEEADIIESDIEETEDVLRVPIRLAKEIVQPYPMKGDVYKPAEELKQAVDVSGTLYITPDHPDEKMVKKIEDIYGHIEPEWNDEDKAIDGVAEIRKDLAPESFVEGVKSGDRDSVSIGFYTKYEKQSGDFEGQDYNMIQRDLVLDHLAIAGGDKVGRCSTEDGCGVLAHLDFKADYKKNFAFKTAEGVEQAADILEELGFEVDRKECSCGKHKEHIVVDELEEDKIQRIRDTYLRKTQEHIDKDNQQGETMGEKDDFDITEADFEEVTDHPEVQKLQKKYQEAQDTIEELEGDLSEMREEQAEDLREDMRETFDLSEDVGLEEMDFEELQDKKSFLESAIDTEEDEEDDSEDDGEEGDGEEAEEEGDNKNEATDIQGGTGNDTTRSKKVIKPESGPNADSWNKA